MNQPPNASEPGATVASTPADDHPARSERDARRSAHEGEAARGGGSVAATLRRLGPASVLAVASVVLPVCGMGLLVVYGKPIAHWLKANESVGLSLYVAGFTVLAGFALLPTYVQAVIGGYAFGLACGLPAAFAGYVGAAAIGYATARRASGDRVVKLIEEHPKWKAVCDALLGSGFWRTLGIVTLLRLPPNSPFAATNLALAATRVPLTPYLLGTLLGMAPRTGLVVFVGSGLAEIDFSNHDARWMFIAGIIVTVAVLAVIGHLANRAIAKVAGR